MRQDIRHLLALLSPKAKSRIVKSGCSASMRGPNDQEREERRAGEKKGASHYVERRFIIIAKALPNSVVREEL
jgi:hypothetical protein